MFSYLEFFTALVTTFRCELHDSSMALCLEGITFLVSEQFILYRPWGWTDYASKVYSENLDKLCYRSLCDKDIDNCT